MGRGEDHGLTNDLFALSWMLILVADVHIRFGTHRSSSYFQSTSPMLINSTMLIYYIVSFGQFDPFKLFFNFFYFYFMDFYFYLMDLKENSVFLFSNLYSIWFCSIICCHPSLYSIIPSLRWRRFLEKSNFLSIKFKILLENSTKQKTKINDNLPVAICEIWMIRWQTSTNFNNSSRMVKSGIVLKKFRIWGFERWWKFMNISKIIELLDYMWY